MSFGRNQGSSLWALTAALVTLATGLLAAQAFSSFGTAKNFPAGQEPKAVLVGQFTTDTKRDLVVTNESGIALLTGTGTGNFGPPRTFPVAGGSPADLAAGRFNADENRDLVVPGPSTNVSIMLGDGNGGFSPPAEFSTGPTARWSPRAVAVADMDGDGFQDVVASTTEGISVLTGNGDGTFAPPLARDIGETAPVGLALGTLNDDPKTDVVFGTGPAANYVGVLLGTGDGQFSTYSQFPAGTLPENVAIDEFDGDQNLDIVAANARSNTLSVLPGRGDGTFESFRTLYLKPARSSAGEVAIRDFNRDGRSDLAVLVLGNNGYDPSVPVRDRLNLLIGNGRGGFSTPAVYEIGKTPLGLDTGVLNEGPDPDLVTANSDSNDVSVLLNAGPSARILALGFKAAQRRFVGSIRSSDPTCISGQRIRILKRRAGPDRRVGSVVTGEAGSFRLGYGRKPGTYYARVRPWSACRAESSKVVRIRR